MPIPQLFDRVWEKSLSTGLGSFTLAGAISVDYLTFGSVLTNGTTTPYVIQLATFGEWEVGVGTWSTGGILARTTVLASSNGGSLVNFTAGAKDVWIDAPAAFVTLLAEQFNSLGTLGNVLTDQGNGTAIFAPAGQPVNAQTGTSYAIADADRGSLTTFSNGSAVAVSIARAGTAGAFPAGWFADYRNLGLGVVTITPATSTIDGAASLAIPHGMMIRIVSDGTNYQVGASTNIGTWNPGGSGTTPSINLSFGPSSALFIGNAPFGPSGVSAAAGNVPSPGTLAGTTHFLREDATWAVPPSGSGTVTSVNGARGTRTDSGSAETTTATLWGDQPVNAQTGTSYAIADADRGSLTTLNNASAVAVSLARAGTAGVFPAGWFADYRNLGAGTATITVTTSTINGASTFVMPQGTTVRIVSDGTNYQVGSVTQAGASGQLLIGQGTSSLPLFTTLSGSGASFSLSSAGVLTVSNIANASLVNDSITLTPAAGGIFISNTAPVLGGSTEIGLEIPVAIVNGGTNSTTALSNGFVIVSSGGALVESGISFSGTTITASLTGHASLDLALTGGTMSGAIAMGSSKITGLANGSASSDAAAYVQTPAGGATVTIGQGGTNSTTALGNGCVIVSSGGALVESGTLKTGGGSGLTGLGTPTGSTDAPNKAYVDGVAQGLSVKQSCQCATTAPLPTYTYLSGVITMTATGTLTIDGHLTALGDRVLVNKEATINQPYQGIYTVTTAGAVGTAAVMARATDSNTAAELETAFTFIEFGSVNAATGWVNTNTGTIVVGTTAITYAQFSGAGEYTADGTTLALTGNQFSIVSTYVGQTSITTLGTVGTGTWTGTTIAIAHGGTGVTSVTTSPTASAWAGWDANKNISANSFLPAITEYNSASGTTTLTVSSTFIQYFYGTLSSAILKMPVASTLSAGQSWLVINEGAGNVTVSSSGSNTIAVIPPGVSALITCITASGTTAASWNAAWIGTIGDGVTTEVGGGIVSVISGVYDAYGTSATETARAEAAEALLAPLASPALTGTPTLNGVDISVPIPTNYVINGGMQFQQPLTFNGSSSVAYGGPGTNDTYTFDQIKGNTQSAANTITVTQIAGGPNSPYYAKFSSAGAFGMIQYEVIESFQSLALVNQGAKVTAQVQAKMPTGAQKMTIAIIGWSGTADTLTQAMVTSWASGASTDPTLAANFAVIAKTTTGSALTSSFQQVSVTTTLSTSSGYNNLIVAVWFDSASSVAVEFDITELGLFVAPGVVPWQQPDTAIEYDRVRRFSELFGGNISTEFLALGNGQGVTTAGLFMLEYGLKRAVPTLSFAAATHFEIVVGGTTTALTAIASTHVGTRSAIINATTGSGNVPNASEFLAATTTAGMILVNAEL